MERERAWVGGGFGLVCRGCGQSIAKPGRVSPGLHRRRGVPWRGLYVATGHSGGGKRRGGRTTGTGGRERSGLGYVDALAVALAHHRPGPAISTRAENVGWNPALTAFHHADKTRGVGKLRGRTGVEAPHEAFREPWVRSSGSG